jgi:hypothetical protein
MRGYTVILNNGQSYLECETPEEARITASQARLRLDVYAVTAKGRAGEDICPRWSSAPETRRQASLAR